jgi:hypothetical protein
MLYSGHTLLDVVVLFRHLCLCEDSRLRLAIVIGGSIWIHAQVKADAAGATGLSVRIALDDESGLHDRVLPRKRAAVQVPNA